MTWVRLDDEFPSHRKVRRLSDAAFRIHVSALCWASKYTTNGVIDAEDLLLLASDIDDRSDPGAYDVAVKQLVDRNVWHSAEHDCPDCPRGNDGWVIHNYLDKNPSAEVVKTQRAQAADRQRRSRERRTPEHQPQPRPPADTDREPPPATADVTRDVTPPVTRESQHPTPTPTPKKKNNSSARKQNDYSAEFEEFWATYPKRIGKDAAYKAYKAARERGATHEAIMAGARAYRDDGPRKRAEKKYTAHPATWLNAGRWQDELDDGSGPRPFWEN